MLFAAGAGVVQLIRGRLYETRWLLKLYTWMWPTGFIAVLAGWFTTEIGRQPWVVWELQTTSDALSPVPGASVATSLLLFFLVYGLVFGAGIYYLLQLIRSGPGEVEGEPEKGTARRPLSAAGKPAEEGT
jgi:cytochrome d ubiquinol oxidase subunit I